MKNMIQLQLNFFQGFDESFDSVIEKIKALGYSVNIRNSGSKKVIMWSTETHWACASFVENSDEDVNRVKKRLQECICEQKIIDIRRILNSE